MSTWIMSTEEKKEFKDKWGEINNIFSNLPACALRIPISCEGTVRIKSDDTATTAVDPRFIVEWERITSDIREFGKHLLNAPIICETESNRNRYADKIPNAYCN